MGGREGRGFIGAAIDGGVLSGGTGREGVHWGGHRWSLSSLGFYSAPFQVRISVHIGTGECTAHHNMCLVVHITCVQTGVCMAH